MHGSILSELADMIACFIEELLRALTDDLMLRVPFSNYLLANGRDRIKSKTL